MESFVSKKSAYVGKIAEFILKNGISESSLKKMAEASLTSDRMLMHYFKDKEEILTLALKQISQDLIKLLNGNPELRLGFGDFLAYLSQAINNPQFKPYLNLWFELAHLASAEEEPYYSISREIGESYWQWLMQVFKPQGNEDREKMSALIYAITEGFVFLNKIGKTDQIAMALEAAINLYTVKES